MFVSQQRSRWLSDMLTKVTRNLCLHMWEIKNLPCWSKSNRLLLGLILTLYSGAVKAGKLHREEENPKVPNLCSNLETKSNDLPLCVDNHFIFHWYFTGERQAGFSETHAITCSLLGEGSILPRVLPSQ